MKTNLDFNYKQLPATILQFLNKYSRYKIALVLLMVGLVYGYLVINISQATQVEPSETQINEQLGTMKRLKIDQNSVSKIEQLEDQNVVVQSLFETARSNPFQEE